MNLTELESPCFIFNTGVYNENAVSFSNALKRHFNSHIIGVSVKTNALPYMLCMAKEFGYYAEVVSHDEYELALLCGFEKSRIIYNGPMKSKTTFIDAALHGAIINIETHREIDWLQELPSDRTYKIGIRINVNLTNFSAEDDPEHTDSRFGFSYESGDFVEVYKRLISFPHIKVNGLHIHRHSNTRSLLFYRRLTQLALNIAKQYNISLDYLDIGGGFFGIFRDKPTYEQYASAISVELNKYPEYQKICLIVEPGNALTASAFDFLSTVIDVKKTKDNLYVTTDASRNDLDPTYNKTDYIKEIIYTEELERKQREEQIICGCTCLEFDRLFTIKQAPELVVGDIVLYHNVGAYTMCLTPLFIRYIPNVYACDANGNVKLVRNKWTAREYIALSSLS